MVARRLGIGQYYLLIHKYSGKYGEKQSFFHQV